MKDKNFAIGSVVLSKTGRDKGYYFVVVAVGDFIMIADGDKHMLASPKKKNPMHLASTEQILEAISEKLISNRKVFDSELKSALRRFNQPSNS